MNQRTFHGLLVAGGCSDRVLVGRLRRVYARNDNSTEGG